MTNTIPSPIRHICDVVNDIQLPECKSQDGEVNNFEIHVDMIHLSTFFSMCISSIDKLMFCGEFLARICGDLHWYGMLVRRS